MRKTLLVAHRGAPALARENTIESFERAIGLGADMIEFDVRETKDRILIVYHDERIEGRLIKELTYEEISRIAKGQGFSVPTLEQVLERTAGRIRLDVEMKEGGYERDIAELLLKYLKKDQFVVTSFYDSCVKRIKEMDPDIKTGLILGVSRPKNLLSTRLSEFFPHKRYREAKADFLLPHWKLLWFGFLRRTEREKIPVLVWVVNEEKMIRRLLNDPRVDGIITDNLELAISLRNKRVSGS